MFLGVCNRSRAARNEDRLFEALSRPILCLPSILLIHLDFLLEHGGRNGLVMIALGCADREWWLSLATTAAASLALTVKFMELTSTLLLRHTIRISIMPNPSSTNCLINMRRPHFPIVCGSPLFASARFWPV